MPSASGTAHARLALAFAAAAVLAGFGWWWQGRSVALPEAPEERLPCVSYSPFHRGDPLDPAAFVAREAIARDLDVLARRFRCVRTYSVDQGLDAVVPEAAARGLTVLLGAWIGRDAAGNERQIAGAVALARAYPATVGAVIVGNEVLLRGEQTPEALAALLHRVRAQVPVPVTYADVWEFWLRHPALAAAADRVTIHILPYWEDEPRSVAAAVPYAFEVVRRVQAAFPGKPVFIGEIGWPSRGRTRSGAVPGRVEQARFLRGFVAAAAARGLVDYALFEAFDQPWKRRLEGTVGGYWGLHDTAGRAKFSFAGPVARDPGWPLAWLGAAAAGALLLFGALARRPPTGATAALGAAYALAAGSGLVLHLRHAAAASRSPAEAAAALALAALVLAVAWIALRSLANRADPAAPLVAPPPLGLAALAWALRREPARLLAPGGPAGLLRAGGIAFASFTTLTLLFDPRYRDIPWGALLPVAIGLLLWPAVGPAPAERRTEGGFALLLWAAALLLVVKEGVANTEAVAWALLAALAGLALRRPRLPALAGLGRGKRCDQAEQEAGGAERRIVERQRNRPER